MSRTSRRSRTSRARLFAAVAAALAGATTGVMVGVAIAKTTTLRVAKNAQVKNVFGMTKQENLVVNSRAFPVYWLSGETKAHPECTKANGCFSVWFPVTVSSAKKLSKGPGVPGKIGTWRRSGITQVTLGGHAVYTFASDSARQATGDDIMSFGGTWHVVQGGGANGANTTTGTTTGGTTSTYTSGTTTTSTTTTTTCAYPPYCY